MIEIKTSAYWNREVKSLVNDNKAVAVGITRYPPKYELGYELSGVIKELAPTSRLLYSNSGQGQFKRLFFEELKVNWSMAENKLIDLSERFSGKTIFLLCYENILKLPVEDNWCHRIMVADFIKSIPDSSMNYQIEELRLKTYTNTLKEIKPQIAEQKTCKDIQLGLC